jgi:methyl-accepting chemotaxis protein
MSSKTTNVGGAAVLGRESVPTGFTRRLITVVELIFMATMALFVFASFVSERRMHYRETFEHLEETLGILSILPQVSPMATTAVISEVEVRLWERTGVAHRVMVADGDFVVKATSDPVLLNRDLRDSLEMKAVSSGDARLAFASGLEDEWLIASAATRDSDNSVYLMRSRGGSEEFIGEFLGLHGLHILVTIILFAVLLRYFSVRYVRRPILQLAAHVQNVEAGELASELSISGDDEFAWLADRFEQMGKTLKTAVEKLVRVEKYTTASGVAWRVAREMHGPLESLKRHVLFLEGVASSDPELREVADSLQRDRKKVVEVLLRLNEIRPPESEAGEEGLEVE